MRVLHLGIHFSLLFGFHWACRLVVTENVYECAMLDQYRDASQIKCEVGSLDVTQNSVENDRL